MGRGFRVLKNFWKLIVLIFLVILTFSYAMFQGGFVSWFLFYSFMPFALYGLGLSIFGLGKITVKRTLAKQELNPSEKLLVKVQLLRSSSFPLFYMIIEDQISDEFGNPLNIGSAKIFITPYFRRKIEFEYRVEGLPRGVHHFKTIHIKTGDPVGLLEKQIYLPTSQEKVIVYPRYEELVYRPINNSFDQGTQATSDKTQRDASIPVGIREYQSGDRFSWINWKATAKRNVFMTKEFEQYRSREILIIMDCAPDRSFEEIVSFTASIIRAILKKGVQVGLLTSSENRAFVPIRGGEVHQKQLFYQLAKVADNSPVRLEEVLDGESVLTSQNASFLLVTSQLSKSLVEKASYIRSKKGSITIFLIKSEQDSVSKEEISLKAAANARGVHIVIVHKGHFSDAFLEVNRG